MTAYQSLRIYEILGKHIGNTDETRTVAQEIEQVIEPKGQELRHISSQEGKLPKYSIGQATDTEEKFNELAKKWKSETGLYSTSLQKINDTYLEIILKGKEFLPYILTDLERGGSAHWHTALKIITGHNPFPDNNLSDSKLVRATWTAWAKMNKII